MDRPLQDATEAQGAGKTAGQRGGVRFDPVAFRQTSGLMRSAEATPTAAETAVAATTLPNAAGRRFPTYVIAWAGLGLLSAAYLGALTWQRIGSLDMAVAPVTETLERLATDIAELKQTTAAIDARGRATADRVTATETRLDGFAQMAGNLPQTNQSGLRPTNRAALEAAPATPATPVAAATASPAPAARMAGIELVHPPVPPTKQLATVIAPAVQTVAVAPAAAAVKPANRPAAAVVANPIQTGSLATTVTTRQAGLLVASGPSLDSIRLSWTVLNQNHSAVLGTLEPRILPAGDGSAFQLIAGPFASDAEAQKACATLRARGVGCKPAEFSGAPL